MKTQRIKNEDYSEYWVELPNFIVDKSREQDRNENPNYVIGFIPQKPFFISNKNLMNLTKLTGSSVRYYTKKLISNELIFKVLYKHQTYFQRTKKGKEK